MPPLLIILVVLVGGIWALRKYSKLTPRESRIFTSKLVAVGVMGFAGLLMLRGQFTIGSGLLFFGMGLYGTAQLPSLKSLWQARQGKPGNFVQPRNHRREKALAILGLRDGASDEDIRRAHRQMMKDHHPDAGGSEEMASKINAAKDVLLG